LCWTSDGDNRVLESDGNAQREVPKASTY